MPSLDSFGLYDPDEDCYVCTYRILGQEKVAIQAMIPLDLVAADICPACLNWLLSKSGSFENGTLIFLSHDPFAPEEEVTPLPEINIGGPVRSSQRCEKCGVRVMGIPRRVSEREGGKWITLDRRCGCGTVRCEP
jgi:hypothetical protein